MQTEFVLDALEQGFWVQQPEREVLIPHLYRGFDGCWLRLRQCRIQIKKGRSFPPFLRNAPRKMGVGIIIEY